MKTILTTLLLILNSTFLILNSSAANRFWIAGSTADWNNTANWSTSSGGSGGASVPGSSDVAKFDGNGTGNCTINATVNVAGIDLASGYSGTITQGSYVVTIGSSHYTQAGGTFTGGSAKIDLNGRFILSGGTFTSTSDTLFNGGSLCSNYTVFTHSGGTFTTNSGTVVFDPYCYETGYTIDVISSTQFNNVVAKHSSIVSLSPASGDTIKIAGNFNHNSGDLGGAWDLKGNLKVNGNANATYLEGQIIFSGTGSQTYEYSAGRTVRIKINKTAGDVTPLSGTTALKVQGFVLVAGSFTAPSGDFTIGGRVCTNTTVFNHTGGTFTNNSGRLIFDSYCWDSNYTIDVLTSTLFYSITAKQTVGLSAATGDTIKLAGNLNHNCGDLGGIWELKGNLKVDGTAYGNYLEGQIVFSGTVNQTYEYSAGNTVRIKVNKSSGSVTPAPGTSALKVQGFSLTAGNFTAPSGDFTIGGRVCNNLTVFNHAGGTYVHNNGKVIFTMSCFSSNYTIDLIPSTCFYNVTDNHQNAIQLNLATGDTLHVDNEMKFQSGLFNTGVIAVKGKVIAAPGNGVNAQLLFCGTADQDFDLTGYTGYYNGPIKIKKPSGKVNLLSACVLDATSQTLTFVKGNIATTSTNLLTLGDNVTVSGMSDSGYVAGPMKKVGNDAFTFPVGKNGHYRKIGISAPSSTTDAYTAEYFEQNSNDTYSHSAKDGSITELSRNEYWNLTRTTGTSNVSVTLSWDTLLTSCTFADKADLKVSVWDGSTWKDKGNGGTTGTLASGTVVSSGTSGVFGAYAVGTSTGFECTPGIACIDAIRSL